MAEKRRPSKKEKEKLDNSTVPHVTLKAMKKALEDRDLDRHDEMYRMLLDEAKKKKN